MHPCLGQAMQKMDTCLFPYQAAVQFPCQWQADPLHNEGQKFIQNDQNIGHGKKKPLSRESDGIIQRLRGNELASDHFHIHTEIESSANSFCTVMPGRIK